MTPQPFSSISAALRWLCCVALALFTVWPRSALALDVPPLQAHVNDTAGMLSADERNQLEQQLADYERKTGRQFALLTIPSLEGDALESFSIRVVEAWKLGKKGKDDGLLLLVVQKERKLRIEVGYGLEGTITDAISSRVTRNVIAPAFRAGNVGGGITQALDVLMRQAAGEDGATPPDVADPPGRSSQPLGWIVLLFFLAPFIIPFLFFRGRGRGRGPWGGGGWGGFGGGGLGGGGFGGGGFGGGGGWGGGSGGGGGFSGGGGGFGGGGSSGSW